MAEEVGGLICYRTSVSKYCTSQGSNIQMLMHEVEIQWDSKWFGFRRQEKGLLRHHECCFGINHRRYGRNHQLYMLDIVPKDDQQNELTPHVEENEVTNTKGCEILKDNDVRQALKRRRL
jgi:hypothetical protein